MRTSPVVPANHSRGRILVITGLALAILGVVAFPVQLWLQRLVLPWYMPTLAFLGAVLIGLSLWKRRTFWRMLALGTVVLLTCAEIAAFTATRLPPYTGPITVGRPFPAFESKRADGTLFTQHDLAGEQDSALVFFRGRW